MLVAVYGSLRKNMGNHRLMEGSGFLGNGTLTKPATMFSMGGFPVLSFALEQPDLIKAELYDVANERDMAMLDRLEGYPEWYTRTEQQFEMEDGSVLTAWIYHQDKDFRERLPIVQGGDWVKYRMAS